MNPLEEIKQKLMVKPTIEERERVAVVIKGEKKRIQPTGPKKTKNDVEEEKIPEEGDLSEEIVKEHEKTNTKAPIIIDATDKGFDRFALLKKLKESKMIKVFTKPHLEEEEEKKVIEPIPLLQNKKAKKLAIKTPMVIEEEEEVEKQGEEIEEKFAEPLSPQEFEIKPKKKVGLILEEDESPEGIPIIAPKKTERKTKKPEKGIAVLGPETIVQIGDTPITKRLPKKTPPILIKASSYYMNNREIFVNFINSLFEPYRIELQENKESISCDTIGKTSSSFSLLTHQKIVRDYINLYTPYRGLLLYHGLGSGKTCTSIAIAEGMKESKCVFILTPASLQANYREELKKCGDLLYKRNQFWEWISIKSYPEALEPMSAILNLSQSFIQKNGGAWFVNIKKKSNYDELSDHERKSLEDQLNEMINYKYKFINYNGLRSNRLSELTSEFTKNIFDNSVVVIDEAHNLISRIVNKIKKEKPISGEEKSKKPGEENTNNIFGDETPINLATKLYYMLLRAQNCRIILLSGTPVINYPNEFGILFNILRGYIKTWQIPLNIKTTKKIDKNVLQEMLLGQKTLDYLDYSPSNKMLTITRNPFGFKNIVKRDSGYQGVQTNYVENPDYNPNVVETKEDKKRADCKKEKLNVINDPENILSDDDFERKIINTLRKNDIEIIPDGITIKSKKALPDTLDLFEGQYIDFSTKKLKNIDALKRRILGLSSYFKSAQESLLPKYNKQLGVDYHIIRIEMSDFQFKMYETARKEERKTEKKQKKNNLSELYKESTSTYRIFSRLYCNFVMPERPIPLLKSKKEEKGDKKGEKKEEENEEEPGLFNDLLRQAQRDENAQDINGKEGEVEGDEILDNIGGINYKERLDGAIKNIEEHANDFLTPEALQTYSPKFLNMLENIKDPDYQGLHLVYSQFRTAEGIGLFSLVLNKNGFARFTIKKNSLNLWQITIPEADEGKPTYALYTGTETSEEKEIVRHIYNGEWDQIPDSIGNVLKRKYHNNNMGEVIKVFMITSSGSEGINLRNTRYVHIMEPYWHPVRLEQVIGRARRICSHKDLPLALQTVEVFVYLMIFSPEQLKSDLAIELKQKDLSKAIPKLPQTSDQYLYEISEIKSNLTNQLSTSIKESAFDCYIYSNGKCVNFGDPTNDKFSYVPDYTEQQNDTTLMGNQQELEWIGKPISINGVDYVYRRVSKSVLNIYDRVSYEAAMHDSSIIPLQVGTLETNENGEQTFKKI